MSGGMSMCRPVGTPPRKKEHAGLQARGRPFGGAAAATATTVGCQATCCQSALRAPSLAASDVSDGVLWR
jgi:hypothetical protein